MVYRSFTWNLTASEAAALVRIISYVEGHGAPLYIQADCRRLMTLHHHWDEVRTDGTSSTEYFYADS